jgi:hypothetical protein
MVVRGTFSATGANSAFGPQTGPESDCWLYIDNCNYNGFLTFRSWDNGIPQVDGWVRGRRGFGLELHSESAITLQVGSGAIASVTSSALDIASGKVLKVGGIRVVGNQQNAIADDNSGAANQATLNAVLMALRNHGLIST